MKGRKPTPTAVLRMRGSWHAKEPGRDEEPVPPAGEMVKPDWLTSEAAVVWDRVLPPILACGIPTTGDVEQFANFCELQAKFIAALDDVNKHGQWQPVFDKEGNEVGNEIRGSMQIVLKLTPMIQRLADAFGLNPAARPRIKPAKASDVATDKGKGRFFNQGSG